MTRKTLAILLLAAAATTTLSACLPVVAAGAGGALLVGADRRTTGVYVDDQSAEVKIGKQIADTYPAAHVNVTSYNRVVLLTGEVPDEATKRGIELLARGQPNVRRVHDQTVLAPVSSLGNRLNDSSLTSKIKARMVTANLFSPNHVKVVSERGEAYLLGLVTPDEASAAARITSETAGVLKVHTFFQLIDSQTNQMLPDSQQPG